MRPLPILRWPDPRLSQRCHALTGVTPAVRRLAQDMLDAMYAAKGRGLAAPQVGVLQRMFVMDATWKVGAPSPRVFLNPVIHWASPETAPGPEGCLSIPGVEAQVRRATSIHLRWRDLDGQTRGANLTGFEAVCAQHEIDHLDGLVTFDRVDAATRATLETAYAA